MSSSESTPVGVKVLADHLVKVKLSYEEQIYQLLTKLKVADKENKELKNTLNSMEEELEERRSELFQLKRESSDHWRIEERENWKAALNQVQRDRKRLADENTQLKNDVENYKNRINNLEKQLLDHESIPVITSLNSLSPMVSPVVIGPPLLSSKDTDENNEEDIEIPKHNIPQVIDIDTENNNINNSENNNINNNEDNNTNNEDNKNKNEIINNNEDNNNNNNEDNKNNNEIINNNTNNNTTDNSAIMDTIYQKEDNSESSDEEGVTTIYTASQAINNNNNISDNNNNNISDNNNNNTRSTLLLPPNIILNAVSEDINEDEELNNNNNNNNNKITSTTTTTTTNNNNNKDKSNELKEKDAKIQLYKEQIMNLTNTIKQLQSDIKYNEYTYNKEKDGLMELFNEKITDYQNSLEALKLKLDSEIFL
ncbi:hypothetical protein WA158_000326 [Blastocystis sp. Blastoise]